MTETGNPEITVHDKWMPLQLTRGKNSNLGQVPVPDKYSGLNGYRAWQDYPFEIPGETSFDRFCRNFAAAHRQEMLDFGGGGYNMYGGSGRIACTNATKEGFKDIFVHGNSLKSPKPTWGYKLYSADGTFLKNGITSNAVPETRYTKVFMLDKYMGEKILFPNRAAAYQWELQQNQILRGPLNLNMH